MTDRARRRIRLHRGRRSTAFASTAACRPARSPSFRSRSPRALPLSQISVNPRIAAKAYKYKQVADYGVGPGAVVTVAEADDAITSAAHFVACMTALLG